ncbi:retrovirus-related pol polyprotein from transposon TNT 1-94 [Tanacetum coccineum]
MNSDIEDDIMDPVMQCTPSPAIRVSPQKLSPFVHEIHTTSINFLTPTVEAAENIPPVAAHEEAETIHNMTTENKLYFQAEKEAIFLILTGIGDEIYSTVDACNTAKEMWTAIERLQQVIQKPARGRRLCKKNWHSLQVFKKLYKPTNNNLRTSSNSRNKTEDTTPSINTQSSQGSLEQRTMTVAGARETVGSPVVQQNRIQGNSQFLIYSVSKTTLKCYQVKDKVMPNNSQVKFQKKKVEDHHRISSISKETKSVTACNDSSNSRTLNKNAVCAECGTCVFNSNHDACVSRYLKDVNARTKKPNVVPISCDKPKRKANKSVATPHKKTVASDTTIQKSKSYYKELYENTNQEWKWWIAKRCPSGYTWTQKPLRTKKIWMPKIRKDDESTSISPTIDIVSRITNIVQLILFIVDSGCTKHMTGNLKLLCNFCGENFLGTLFVFENDQFASDSRFMESDSRKCMIPTGLIMSKASIKIFSRWSNSVMPDLGGPIALASIMEEVIYMVIVDDLFKKPGLLLSTIQGMETQQFSKTSVTMIHANLQSHVLTVRTDRGTEFLNKTLHAYFKEEGIKHQTSIARTPEQNGIVERRNRTLVKAGRTMLLASKLPLSFWAEAASFLKDKRRDYDNSDPVPPRQNVVPTAEKTDSSQQGLEFLFSPLLEEYYNPTHGHAEDNNNDQAPNASFQEDEFINPFCTRVQEIGESSSRNIDNTDVHSFTTNPDLPMRPEIIQ